jgi:hypothetical protein
MRIDLGVGWGRVARAAAAQAVSWSQSGGSIGPLEALRLAQSISTEVKAIHVDDDMAAVAEMKRAWEANVPNTPLVILESPYRALIAPLVAYISAVVIDVPFHQQEPNAKGASRKG